MFFLLCWCHTFRWILAGREWPNYQTKGSAALHGFKKGEKIKHHKPCSMCLTCVLVKSLIMSVFIHSQTAITQHKYCFHKINWIMIIHRARHGCMFTHDSVFSFTQRSNFLTHKRGVRHKRCKGWRLSFGYPNSFPLQ